MEMAPFKGKTVMLSLHSKHSKHVPEDGVGKDYIGFDSVLF